MVIELEEALEKLSITEGQFNQYRESYERWVSMQVDAKWQSPQLPELPAFTLGLEPIFENMRTVRASIVSVLNEVKLQPGQVIVSPVGYIHSIVGSHQTHPPSTHPEAKNEAWYIFSIGKDTQGRDRLLYFEPQQTSNTTYSPFDLPTPIVWNAKTGKPAMRKDLTKGLDALLKPGESAPATEKEAIRIIAERGLKFEATKPEDFIVNNRIQDITGTARYANPVRAKAESLIEGTYPVWPEALFTLERVSLEGEGLNNPASITVNPPEDSFYELTVTKGTVEVNMAGRREVLTPGSSIFVPASNKAPIDIRSESQAEVLKLYPARKQEARPVREAVARASREEIAAADKRDEEALRRTISHVVVNQALLDKGTVIVAYDTAIADVQTGQVARAGEVGINKNLGGSLIDIRGTGKALRDAIQAEISKLQAAGTKIVGVVTIAGDNTMTAAGEDLSKLGKVLNVKNPDGRYIPIIGLYDLAMRIAYGFEIENIRDCLNRIALNPDNRPFTMDDVQNLLTKGIIGILPKIVPINTAEAVEAYKAAQQTLVSL